MYKFDVDRNNTASVISHRIMCDIALSEDYSAASGFYCACLPPENRVGHDKEYVCKPAPILQTGRLIPYLGPKMLRQDFLDPEAIVAGGTMVLDQMPKRRFLSELKAIPGSRKTGWGLYIEEFKPSKLLCLYATAQTFSLCLTIIDIYESILQPRPEVREIVNLTSFVLSAVMLSSTTYFMFHVEWDNL